MKKGFFLLFTLYFFFISTGIVLGNHYCGKKVSHTIWGISVFDSNGCKCKHKSNSHSKGCCKQESKWIKADIDDSKISISNFQIKNTELVTFNNLSLVFSKLFLFNNKPILSFQIVHPPPLYKLPTFLQNRTLLI